MSDPILDPINHALARLLAGISERESAVPACAVWQGNHLLVGDTCPRVRSFSCDLGGEGPSYYATNVDTFLADLDAIVGEGCLVIPSTVDLSNLRGGFLQFYGLVLTKPEFLSLEPSRCKSN